MKNSNAILINHAENCLHQMAQGADDPLSACSETASMYQLVEPDILRAIYARGTDGQGHQNGEAVYCKNAC